MRKSFILVLGVLAVLTGKAAAQAFVPDSASCELLMRHQPAPDVAYQPGVGMNGKPVAPADLPDSNPTILTDTFAIGLSIEAEKYLPQPLPSGTDLDMPLGIFTVQGNDVYFNGTLLTPQEEAGYVALCRRNATKDE